ncbi:hypothetical protein ACFY4B_36795 [Kitasatospora sp. NPDC001261]|uniref:hypothetical protein n=1 Tax=Kitasatospora sp. NPDC001261 TaxID=3364012 RepID=UPI003675B458
MPAARRRPAPPRHRVFGSYVENGADAWRIYRTWGPGAEADRQVHHGRDDAVLTVLLIGPHR